MRRIYLSLGLAAGLSLGGCNEWGLPETSGMPTTPMESSTGSTGTEPTTGGPGTSSTTGEPTGSGGGSSSTTTTGGAGGMCDIFKQDCPAGQKCTAFGDPNTYIPDGIKCVPIPDNPKGHNEPCGVGPEGLGDDNCSLGSVCLDLDYDGAGFCLPYCTGDSDNPMCEEDRTCVKLFFGFDFGNCFRKCDPLLQDCNPGEGCYMDAIKAGNTGFVCLPVVQEGQGKGFGDGCFGWSSCSPGFACVFEEFVPSCNNLCCTAWCDLSEPDPCAQYEATLGCVPWFTGMNAPPGLENVGICAVPQ